MPTLQDLQFPIDRQLARGLIAATPDTWNAADMLVERRDEGEDEKLVIRITSPEGRDDHVLVTEEILEGLSSLVELFKSYGRGTLWRKVKYSISLDENGSWKYEVAFEYDDADRTGPAH